MAPIHRATVVDSSIVVLVALNLAVFGWVLTKFPVIMRDDRVAFVGADVALLIAYAVGSMSLLRASRTIGATVITRALAAGVLLGLIQGADIAREYVLALPPAGSNAASVGILLLSFAFFRGVRGMGG